MPKTPESLLPAPIRSVRRFHEYLEPHKEGLEHYLRVASEIADGLGVPDATARVDLDRLIVEWGRHLQERGQNTLGTFRNAVDFFNSLKRDPATAQRKAEALHLSLIQNYRLLDKVRLERLGAIKGSRTAELATSIMSHPFFEAFQAAVVSPGFQTVQQTFNVWETLENAKKEVRGKTGKVADRVEEIGKLKEETGSRETEIIIPGDVFNPTEVVQNLRNLAEKLKIKPELIDSVVPAAQIVFATGTTFSVYRDKALQVYDLSLARYCAFLSAGVLADTVVMKVGTEEAIQALRGATVTQIGSLFDSLAKLPALRR